MNPIARPALLAVCLLAAGAAQANCKPLVEAVNRAAQQSRFAVYEVERAEQALSGEPDVVIIGTVSYVRSGKEWERVEIGDALGGYWADLRKELATGKVDCKTGGTGRYRGAPVTKLVITRPKVSKEASQIFIDQRSGLPVYEGEVTTDGGFAVVYGDAVKEPKVKR